MKHTAEDILKMIDEMEHAERWKLLHEMYFQYYDKEGHEYSPLDLDY